MTTIDPDLRLQLAHCAACGTYTFPANAPACRRCGAPGERLEARPLPAAPRLRNAITLYAQLHAELKSPCVIGEVELAPGVYEEAVIDVADEEAAPLGAALQPVAHRLEDGRLQWRFSPLPGAAA
jgi:uncharacterized OB-fold protein